MYAKVIVTGQTVNFKNNIFIESVSQVIIDYNYEKIFKIGYVIKKLQHVKL